MKRAIAVLAAWMAMCVVAQAQITLSWKCDHIYAGPGGGEIAIVTPPNSDSTVPTTPTGLGTTSTTATTVALSWTGSTDSGGSGIAGYKIYRALGSSGASLPVGTVNSSSTAFTDQGLLPSTAYVYAVRAFDAAQNHSAASSSLNVTTASANDSTAPSVPTGLAATVLNATTVLLSWSPSTDSGSGVAGYKVKRNGTVLNTNGTTALVYEDGSAPANSSIEYKVLAFDRSGNSSADSTALNVTTPPESLPPSPPGNLTAATLSSSSIRLTWNASTDNGGSGIAGYRVYDGATVVSGTNPITATTFDYTGLTHNTTYTNLRVRAFDNAGNSSSPAGPVTATTSVDTSPPTTPTSCTGGYFEYEGAWWIYFTWDASTDSGGSGLNGYRFNGVNGGSETLLESPYSNELSILDYGYAEYRVRAIDNANNLSGAATCSVS